MKKSLILAILAFTLAGCSYFKTFYATKGENALVKWYNYYKIDIKQARLKVVECESAMFAAIGLEPADFKAHREWEQQRALYEAKLDPTENAKCQGAAIAVRNSNK